MTRRRIAGVLLGALGGLMLSSASWAQATAGISGVVKDSSGGVLPGVTVEVASPVLIEKVRSTASDGEGRFNFVDLPNGTYTVTFTLTGFNVVKREGLELTSGFTATVNADLQVGSLEETITVSGAAPLVDTLNVRRQTTATRDVIDALPTSTKRIDTLVTLTPGFTGVADVGGRYNSEPGSYHGKRGTKQYFDGMGIENSSGNSSYQVNAAVVEEMVMQTSGMSAETNADGPVMNVVPKEGGNTFKFIGNALFSNDALESNNLGPELRARKLTEPNKTNKIFDEAVSLGGPIKQDKIWFFAAARTWGMARQFAGLYWNRAQQTPGPNSLLSPPGSNLEVVRYDPWTDRPFDVYSGRWEWYDSYLSRITWQATSKNKFNFLIDHQRACNCGAIASNVLNEAYVGTYRFEPNKFMQLTYNSPITSRLLLEIGIGGSISQWNQVRHTGVQAKTVAITDTGIGKSYGAPTTYRGFPNYTNRYTTRAAMTYVTGAHTVKGGFLFEHMTTDQFLFANGDLSYTFRNGVPQTITQRTTPYLQLDQANEIGLYLQDQWRINRLTVNYGLRFDYVRGFSPAQDVPGVPLEKFTDRYPGIGLASNSWLSPRSFAEVGDNPLWKDIDPRFGLSYDLTGNGRTALKFSVGRYVAKTNVDVPQLLNPIATSVNNTNRSWDDNTYPAGDPRRGNYYPDCDLGPANFATPKGQNGECGPIDNLNFGKTNPRALQWSDAVKKGWGVRDNNWDLAAEVQHELTRGISINGGYYFNNGGYYRNADSPKRQTDNLAVGPTDFDQFCVTSPKDSRLPNGGGYQICGLSAVKADAFLRTPVNSVRPTSDYGSDVRRNHFYGFGVNARLARGIRIGGGFDAGHISKNQCFVVDAQGLTTYSINGSTIIGGVWGPQTSTTINGQQTCEVSTPFKGLAMLKINGSVPLPYDFLASAIWQDQAGPAIDAVYAATNAEVAPSLGRSLPGGASSVLVPLMVANAAFEDRIRRLDLRLTKYFNLTKRVRLQTNLDAYNALNSGAIQQVNTTYGANWLQPLLVLDPRILQVSAQLTF